jgi:DNA replication protein DnaC
MTLVELDRALRQRRLSGMADVLETRLRHAQAERLPPLDLIATLVSDELRRREDRLLARRHKLAAFRDPDRSLENFDFDFNKKMNRALVFDLATARFIQQREDALFLGPPGTGKSHLAQAIGRAAIQQGSPPARPTPCWRRSPRPRSMALAKRFDRSRPPGNCRFCLSTNCRF